MDAISTCCPTCRQPLPADDCNWDEEARTFIGGGVSVRFTRTQGWIMGALWRARRRGGIPNLQALMDATYANDINGGPECSSTVSVLLMQIRNKLEPTGYTITRSYDRPRRGYQIVKIAAAT